MSVYTPSAELRADLTRGIELALTLLAPELAPYHAMIRDLPADQVAVVQVVALEGGGDQAAVGMAYDVSGVARDAVPELPPAAPRAEVLRTYDDKRRALAGSQDVAMVFAVEIFALRAVLVGRTYAMQLVFR